MPAKKRVLGSDLKKVDRHVIQPHEYDEVPELTDEMFERADLYQESGGNPFYLEQLARSANRPATAAPAAEESWGGRRVSNPRPPEPQSGVLPLNYAHHITELVNW